MVKAFFIVLQCVVFLVSCVSCSAVFAAGWERTLHVEWGYAPPTDLKVSGFVLYQDGVEACAWNGADVRSGDCKTTISTSATNFTLAARFENGPESPRSAPFTLTDFGEGPNIIILIGK